MLRRNDDFKRGRDRAIAPPDLYVILGKSHFIRVRFDPARLVCGRPDRAAVSVAKENVRSPGITRAVLPPSCDRKVSPMAVSGAAVVTITTYCPLERRWVPGV